MQPYKGQPKPREGTKSTHTRALVANQVEMGLVPILIELTKDTSHVLMGPCPHIMHIDMMR